MRQNYLRNVSVFTNVLNCFFFQISDQKCPLPMPPSSELCDIPNCDGTVTTDAPRPDTRRQVRPRDRTDTFRDGPVISLARNVTDNEIGPTLSQQSFSHTGAGGWLYTEWSEVRKNVIVIIVITIPAYILPIGHEPPFRMTAHISHQGPVRIEKFTHTIELLRRLVFPRDVFLQVNDNSKFQINLSKLCNLAILTLINFEQLRIKWSN